MADTARSQGDNCARPYDAREQTAPRHWRTHFIDHLAETSNVLKAAAHAGVTPARAYRTRRGEPDFARQWIAALAEGYIHLEMEVLRRLREGDFKTTGSDRYDIANAIRLLAAHRATSGANLSATRDVSAAEVRASIDRKIEDIRRRMVQARADKPQVP